MLSFYSDDDEDTGTAKRKHLQKFIFSATLTLPKSFKKKGKEMKITGAEGLGTSRLIAQPRDPVTSSYFINYHSNYEMGQGVHNFVPERDFPRLAALCCCLTSEESF